MRKILNALTAILLAVLSNTSLADTLPSPASARELTDKVMTFVAKGEIEAGIRLLKPYSVVPDAEFEAAIGQLKLQVPVMRERFGKILGSEFLREDPTGNSLIRITQLQKFEKHPMRWIFIFYKSDNGWVLNTFYFDDNIRSLFPS